MTLLRLAAMVFLLAGCASTNAVRRPLHGLSDDPAELHSEMLKRQPGSRRNARKLRNGDVDLSGVWLVKTAEDVKPKALPWAEELAAKRRRNNLRDNPKIACLPGEPWYPVGNASPLLKFVHKEKLLVILFESIPGYRQIFLNGDVPPDYAPPSWMGQSVGRWEKGALVVTTTGLNDRGWTRVYPRTERMEIEERYVRPDHRTMDMELTITDPGVFEEPWRRTLHFDLAPKEELLEYVCENNQWTIEPSS